ncbi:MAG: ABC transporter permease [Aquabacterium sp.]|nr:ABC transporter permease [Aquabacterium sp.]
MTFASDASTPVAKAVFAVVASVALAAALWWLMGTAQQQPDFEPMPLVAPLLAVLCMAGLSVRRVAALDGRPWYATATAALFGLWVLYFWQVGVTLFNVPRVLLPAPAWIGQMLVDRWDTLARDFMQTVGKAVLVGWALGSGLGFMVGVAIDRAPFLQRGLLPLANLTSTVPLVAVAPIMVMWFGFEWPSKAAVVVLMTFFPMLVATLAGLQAAGRLELELMKTYAAGYVRTLIDLRLPMAMPFLFSALKVNATLALIGAIVAEFFGSPTVGLGFRISTEAARMNMGLVWGAIVVAAVTGSVAYALLVQLERRVAFWHPSVRSK